MTSIPFLFPVPGAGVPPAGLAAAEGTDETAFASLVGVEGEIPAPLLDGTARRLLLQSPLASDAPAEILARLETLLGEGSPADVRELIDATLERTGGDDAVLPDLLALILQAAPQAIAVPQGGDAAQAQTALAVDAKVPAAAGQTTPASIPAMPAGAPGAGSAQGEQALSAAGDAAQADDAPPAPAIVDSKQAATTAAAAQASVKTDAATNQAPPSTQAVPAGLQQPAAKADTTPAVDKAKASDRKPADKPTQAAVPANRTGLERALERAADQAQTRIATHLERRTLLATQEGPALGVIDQAADTPDLSTLQGALDAARGVRLVATTSSNGQAQLPLAQLAVQIAAQARAGSNRFSIRLDPPELGKIDIRLEVSQDGSVASRLSVERPETLDMLLRDAKSLERALNEAGLKTDDGSLRFSLKGEGFGQRQQNDAQQRRASRNADQLAALEALNDNAALADVRRYLATSGLDIVV